MTDPAPPAPVVGYRDRKVGLVVCGVTLVLVGGLCGLLSPSLFLAGALEPATFSWRMATGTAALYLSFAAVFAWLGIGSILARRWARTLGLMVAWIWLLTGIVTIAMAAYMLPTWAKWAMLGGTFGSDVERLYPVVIAVVLVGLVGMFVVLPGALILFYRSAGVRATVEARDPRLSWTERRPYPVVLLSLTHAVMAFFFVLHGFMYRWTIPLFGVIAGDWAGALALLASTGLSVYLTVALYGTRPSAWWLATGLGAAWTVSAVLTFLRVPVLAFYEAIELPPETLQIMAAMGDQTFMTIASILAIGVGYLAYLIHAKRYYVGGS